MLEEGPQVQRVDEVRQPAADSSCRSVNDVSPPVASEFPESRGERAHLLGDHLHVSTYDLFHVYRRAHGPPTKSKWSYRACSDAASSPRTATKLLATAGRCMTISCHRAGL